MGLPRACPYGFFFCTIKQMKNPLAVLQERKINFHFQSYSALDQFFRLKQADTLYLLINGSLIALAKAFEELEYPGIPFQDAALTSGSKRYIFQCCDNDDPPTAFPFTVLGLLYSQERGCFLDPGNVYHDLRRRELIPKPGKAAPLVFLAEAARLVSRYHYRCPIDMEKSDFRLKIPPARASIAFQRDLLCSILTGSYPEKGLNLLFKSGFIEFFWPELFKMDSVSHMKDYHPEGDGWEHTMQTFQYRKQNDLTLSLALLLHDIGKAETSGPVEKPFDGHADLGAIIASHFMSRLGFSAALIRNVAFLVKYHMLPGALNQLPLFRTEKFMDSPLFPLLLELYRADLSTTFQGPENYYQACSIYQNYLRLKANPFRKRHHYH